MHKIIKMQKARRNYTRGTRDVFTAQREICMYMGDSNRTPGLAQAQDEVQRRLLLNVVVGERAAVLELLARKDQALLVGRDALLVLDLCFHVLDGVGRLDVQRDRLARERLHEDLHRVCVCVCCWREQVTAGTEWKVGGG